MDSLLVLDIDNTLFDWVRYYVHSFGAMMDEVTHRTGIEKDRLYEEARAVFSEHLSIEYPFVIQELPSVCALYGERIDAMLSEAVEPGRLAFKAEAIRHLTPYAGVSETLQKLKNKRRPIIALTDAPRYVAMWKLNKLGLLHDFDAVYGLSDPRLPTDAKLGRVKVDARILLKHLQQDNFSFKGKIRILPEEYEKPGTRGLKTVMMDYEFDDLVHKRRDVFWVGDNLKKDVALGKRLNVTTMWASYGASVDPEMLRELRRFSPAENVHKNVALDPRDQATPKPDVVLAQFADVLGAVKRSE